jgi:hypothetical protein
MAKLSTTGVNSATARSPYDGMSKEEILAWMNGKELGSIRKTANEWEVGIWGAPEGWTFDKYQDPFFATKNSLLTRNGFDIIVSWGSELLSMDSKTDEQPGTVTIINQVHLTGVSQVVQPTGEAIFEDYTFIARDLNNSLKK